MDLLDKALTSGIAQTNEIVWPDQRVFAAVFTPIEAGGCVAILNDVTRFKMLEQVKNEFIATATHGLKNTLTKITLMSQLVPKLGPLNEKQTEYIANISETATAMDKLVQNLLNWPGSMQASLESKRAPVNVNELTSAIAQEFQLQANARQQTLQLETSQRATCYPGRSFPIATGIA